MISDTWKKLKKSIDRNLKYNWKRFHNLTQKHAFYVRNHDNSIVSMSFPAWKSKIERKIAMKLKTWDKLKANYLIALLHISMKTWLICFK